MSEYSPKTLDEAVEIVLNVLTEEQTEELKSMNENDLGDCHFGFGIWVRNNLIFTNKNSNELLDSLSDDDIKEYERQNGKKIDPKHRSFFYIHTDNASEIIIKEVWKRLNNIEGQKKLISLHVKNDYAGLSHRIELIEILEQPESKTYMYKIYLGSGYAYKARTTSKAISSKKIELLFEYINQMNLPINPEHEFWCDTSDYILYINDNKYEWRCPVPIGWEPLELIVKWIEIDSDLESFIKKSQRRAQFEQLKIINKRQIFHYELPDNHCKYVEYIEPAGIFYKIAQASEFVKKNNLFLEPEPTNEHDLNAIKVFGCSKDDSNLRCHIGYLPKELAAAITNNNLFDEISAMLVKTYFDFRTNSVEVRFDLVIPKNKKSLLEKAHSQDGRYIHTN